MATNLDLALTSRSGRSVGSLGDPTRSSLVPTSLNPMDIEQDSKDFKDYLSALRRRKKVILAISTIILLIGGCFALLLPPTYRSAATILIEQQEIPPDFVRSTISSYADQRIQVISQHVMTRVNLSRIVDKYNLYPSQRASSTSEEIVGRLSKAIRLDLLKADVIDPRGGGKANAVIAFTLAYEGETPAVTQQVTNELATLFLSENIKTREQKAAETSSFLTEEAAKLNEHVSDIEEKLARFKQRNAGRLPELAQVNLQLRDRTDGEIKELDRHISSLEERKFYLEGQLAQMRPDTPMMSSSGERILGPEDRLRVLRAQYASLAGVYSPDHPDVVKARRLMEALEKEAGRDTDRQDQAKQLAKLRADLAAVREKYSDEHPDVVKLKKSIAALEAQPAAPAHPRPVPVKPENPAYITLQAQLDAVAVDIKTSRTQRAALEAKLAAYDRRIEQTPEVEREYLNLTRDHEASLARYRDIKAKQMQAQIGEELEKDRKAERFSLIDPPQLPEKPSSPNRPAILLLGFILAVGGGLGSGAVLESLDDSVHGSRALGRVLALPVLGVIPSVEEHVDTGRKRRRRWIILLCLTGAVAIALAAVHFFVLPLDVLWFRALRSLGAYVPWLTNTPLSR